MYVSEISLCLISKVIKIKLMLLLCMLTLLEKLMESLISSVFSQGIVSFPKIKRVHLFT